MPVDPVLLAGNPLIGQPVGDTVTVNLLASDSDPLRSGTTFSVENPNSGNGFEVLFDMGADLGEAEDTFLGQKLVITIEADGSEQVIKRWIVGSDGDGSADSVTELG